MALMQMCPVQGRGDSTPSVEADGKDLLVRAPGGSVKFETASCGVVDTCKYWGCYGQNMV